MYIDMAKKNYTALSYIVQEKVV